MKKLLTGVYLLAVFAIAREATAQIPQAINYQAVARDNGGIILANQTLGLQCTILDNSTPVYVEQFTTATNIFGLFTVALGSKRILLFG